MARIVEVLMMDFVCSSDEELVLVPFWALAESKPGTFSPHMGDTGNDM